jgi:hypothetical protein
MMFLPGLYTTSINAAFHLVKGNRDILLELNHLTLDLTEAESGENITNLERITRDG